MNLVKLATLTAQEMQAVYCAGPCRQASIMEISGKWFASSSCDSLLDLFQLSIQLRQDLE
jgi:NADH:ubiquinone oxidoreductase subunit E